MGAVAEADQWSATGGWNVNTGGDNTIGPKDAWPVKAASQSDSFPGGQTQASNLTISTIATTDGEDVDTISTNGANITVPIIATPGPNHTWVVPEVTVISLNWSYMAGAASTSGTITVTWTDLTRVPIDVTDGTAPTGYAVTYTNLSTNQPVDAPNAPGKYSVTVTYTGYGFDSTMSSYQKGKKQAPVTLSGTNAITASNPVTIDVQANDAYTYYQAEVVNSIDGQGYVTANAQTGTTVGNIQAGASLTVGGSGNDDYDYGVAYVFYQGTDTLVPLDELLTAPYTSQVTNTGGIWIDNTGSGTGSRLLTMPDANVDVLVVWFDGKTAADNYVPTNPNAGTATGLYADVTGGAWLTIEHVASPSFSCFATPFVSVLQSVNIAGFEDRITVPSIGAWLDILWINPAIDYYAYYRPLIMG